MSRSRLIDCAVLLHGPQENWLDAWLGRDFSALPKLHLHVHSLLQNPHEPAPVAALHDASLLLRRYDAALLPVSYSSLSRVRTMLANTSRDELQVPLLALVSDLQAVAIQDLFDFGVADFLRADTCLDDLRVRLGQLVRAASAKCVWQPLHDNSGGYRIASPVQHALADVSAVSRHEPACHARTDLPEPFQEAKRRVVASFERDYIIRMLVRYAGNISMAARAAQKHRRAFWALMHKHQIDASLYRDTASVVHHYRAAAQPLSMRVR